MKYACPKCGSRLCTAGEIRTTGSFLTKIFDIQNRRFTSVTCSNCKYTEFYSITSRKIGNILDFLPVKILPLQVYSRRIAIHYHTII